MPGRLAQWVERLGSESLPILENTRRRVRLLANAPSTSNPDLAKVVANDMGLSLHLLRIINKKAPASREPIRSLSHAVSMLGRLPLVTAVSRLPVIEHDFDGATRTALTASYSRAAHASYYARNLSKARDKDRQEEIATAAMFQEIAEVALWCQPDNPMQEVGFLMTQGAGADEAATAALGIGLRELSHALSCHWRLPELVSQSLEPFNSFLVSPFTVMLGAQMARATSLGWYSDKVADSMELAAEFLDIPLAATVAHIHCLAAEIGRELGVMGLPVAAFELPQPPTTEAIAKVPAKTRPRRTRHDRGEETRAQHRGSHQIQTGAVSPSRRSTPARASTNPVHQSLTRIIREIRGNLQLERVFFAMMSRDRKHLKARFVSQGEENKDIGFFSQDLGGRDLFSILMAKPQAIWLNAGNRDKYLPLISPNTRRLLDTESFFAMSLFVRKQPLGLLFADRSGAPKGLNQTSYGQFKRLCRSAVDEMTQRID